MNYNVITVILTLHWHPLLPSRLLKEHYLLWFLPEVEHLQFFLLQHPHSAEVVAINIAVVGEVFSHSAMPAGFS